MKNKSISIIILSLLFSFFMIFGTSFLLYNNCSLIFEDVKHFVLSIIIYILLFRIFKYIIIKIYRYLDRKTINNEDKYKNKMIILFDKYPFRFSLLVIIICWLPYIIAFYPAILNPDSSFQIKQFFGIDNKYSTYSNLLDKNQIITNHHPVIHTLLLGSCVYLGTIMNNVNFGMFIYSIIQILVLSITLSYTIKFMKQNNVSIKYRFICLLIYALVPVFPFYSMTAVKDVIFGSLIIIYIMILYDFIKNKDISIRKLLFSIFIIIMMCLFRNNGIYVFILTFPFLLIKSKKKIFKLSIILISSLGLYLTYDKVILPYFKVTPGSVREVLSIPFQQTARYIKYNEIELSKKDKEIINNILDYNTIKNKYNPELSDPVKNTFNKDYTKEELLNYFNVWYKGLIKHPGTYIEATMNNVYGYFYPFKTNWYFYYKFDMRIVSDGFDYHFNNLKYTRLKLSGLALIWPYIPLLGLITNIGFNTWIIIFMLCYLIYRKKYKEIIVIGPAIVLILVCIASPANTYFRYTLPYIFAMPLIIGLFNDIIMNRSKKYEKRKK